MRLVIIVGGLLILTSAHAANPSRVCLHNRCITVETADTNAARIRGLQGRASMEADQGMLFVFQDEDLYNFWMKDTLIALDLIWLDANRTVVDLKADVQPCRKDPCDVYRPSHKALYVLEVNAGVAQASGIRAGDRAEFKE